MWQVGLGVRKDITAGVLRKKARSEKDGRAASRLLGIANILDGMDRDQAARTVGMTRQTLRDWVRRYNDEGIDGIRNKPKGRPKRALTPKQEQEIETLVTTAPDGVLVRWRRVDIQSEIKKRFDVVVCERTVGLLLNRLGFRRISVRPVHLETDAATQEAFKKTSPPRSQKSCPRTPRAKTSSSGSKTKPASDKKAR
jgi:transposase